MESKLSLLFTVYEDIKEISITSQKDIEKLKNENSYLRDSLNTFYSENEDLKDSLSSREKSCEDKISAIKTLEMAIGAKDKELESFRVHVETFNQIRNSFVNQIGVKHQQVTAANEEIENLKKELADQTKNFSEQMQNLKEEFSSQKANWLYKMRHLEEEKDMLKNCFQNIEAGLGQRIKFETKSNGVNNQLLIDDVRHLVAEKKKLKEKVEDLEAKIVELEDNYATKVKDIKRELQDDNIKGRRISSSDKRSKLSDPNPRTTNTFLEKNQRAEIRRLKIQVCRRDAKIRELSKVTESERWQKRIQKLEKENQEFSEKLTSSLIKYSVLQQSKCQRCTSSSDKDSKENIAAAKIEIDNVATKDEIIQGLKDQNETILTALTDLSEKLEIQRLRNDQTEDELFERCSEEALQLFIWNDGDQDLVRQMKDSADSNVTILNRLVSNKRKKMGKLEEEISKMRRQREIQTVQQGIKTEPRETAKS